MKSNTQMKPLILVGVTAAFATLAFLGTAVIRIPIPASGGYFNLGDTFVMAAALGPTEDDVTRHAMADALGFPQFILATAVVKGVEGALIGLLAGNRARPLRVVIALVVGVVILVGGYYVFEATIYPLLARRIPFFGVTDAAAALAEVVPNLLQGGISAVIAFGIWKILARRANR